MQVHGYLVLSHPVDDPPQRLAVRDSPGSPIRGWVSLANGMSRVIPRVAPQDAIDPVYRMFLDELGASSFGGDVSVDYAARVVAATDNSVYQIVPQAILFPRAVADVQVMGRLAAEERFRAVQFSPRGGGTGTNGGSLGAGICVDLSRYMNRILDFDVASGRVRVEPGVTLDQLNTFLEPHGVFFAPNVAPSDRATIGGMISNDACGVGSRVYGRTSNHIESLSVVLSDGSFWRSHSLKRATAPADVPQRICNAHEIVDEVLSLHAREIRDRFPVHDRFLTGYDLVHAENAAGEIDLTAILSGSEGTLAFVVEAELRVTKIPSHTGLVVFSYATFDEALRDARKLLAQEPTAIETIDETILNLAREDPIWASVEHCIALPGVASVGAINLVEMKDESAVRLEERLAELTKGLAPAGHVRGVHPALDARETQALWSLRKKGVGLLGSMRGARRPVAFVEDCALPPQRLPSFVRALQTLFAEEGIDFGMYGHVDVGCLHVRPALDLRDPADERRLHSISDRVFELVQSHAGVFWGEHGKGLRSEYNPRVFGPVLYGDLCRIKEAFDPYNQMNPGKIATPASGAAKLLPIATQTRGAYDRQIAPSAQRRLESAIACNGNGACFSAAPAQTMCPSMKASGDRVHSPKGRAALLREWARGLSLHGWDGGETGGTRTSRFDLGRMLRSIWQPPDFSHQVYAALDGCLSCKACVGQCPIHVDIPTFKADFLHEYHRRYARTASDIAVAHLEELLPWATRYAKWINPLLDSVVMQRLLASFAGVVDPPKLAAENAESLLRLRGVSIVEGGVSSTEVVLLLDPFTNFFEPRIAIAAYDLLCGMGVRIGVLPYRPSGKSRHVKGYLAEFEDIARSNLETLRAISERGATVICIDPAIALLYRQEVPAALGDATASIRVSLPQEYLAINLESIPQAAREGKPFLLLGHCTESTTVSGANDIWRRVFAAAGLRLIATPMGCCGMAGAYGHEARHVEMSRRIYDLDWAERITSADQSRLLATGHSCRTQVERFAGFTPLHPLQVLAESLEQ